MKQKQTCAISYVVPSQNEAHKIACTRCSCWYGSIFGCIIGLPPLIKHTRKAESKVLRRRRGSGLGQQRGGRRRRQRQPAPEQRRDCRHYHRHTGRRGRHRSGCRVCSAQACGQQGAAREHVHLQPGLQQRRLMGHPAKKHLLQSQWRIRDKVE